jgi:hypothetical protein
MNYQFFGKLAGGVVLLAGVFGHGQSGFAANFVGDGHDDLVVGAPGEAAGASPRSGVAYLFGGSGYGVNPTDILDQGGLDIDEQGDLFGSAFASGDFDGDGLEDLAIGAPGEAPGADPRSGAVFIYQGTAGGLKASSKIDQSGLGTNETDDRFGATLAAADFNGDGFSDLAVGAPGEELGAGTPTGVVFLFLGTPNGLQPQRVIDQTGLGVNEAGDKFAHALSAGDYNGDGKADLAVGAPGEAPGPDERAGVVFIFRGTELGLKTDRVIDQTGLGTNEYDDLFGYALASGDLDDDGRDDLVVGAPGEAPGVDPKSGAVFVFRGTAKGLDKRQILTQDDLGHNEAGDHYGHALTIGDYNGDGRGELAVGAPGKMVGSNPDAGTVYLYRGDKKNLVPLQTITQSGIGANEAYDRFGSSLASGNFVGDYRQDLAVGAPGEAAGAESPSGGVYLFRGYSLGISSERFVDQTGLGSDEPGDMFGAALLDN